MKITPLSLAGAYRIQQTRHTDIRGYFARTFCAETFAAHGLTTRTDQTSISQNGRRGTLRGMHFQHAPHGETRLVRCARGAMFDVIIDIRPDSPTFAGWHGEDLSAENGCMIYVPEGFAHGFMTLTDDVEVAYHMADPFVADASEGVRWDDPDIAIAWPERPTVVSERDAALPNLHELLPKLRKAP